MLLQFSIFFFFVRNVRILCLISEPYLLYTQNGCIHFNHSVKITKVCFKLILTLKSRFLLSSKQKQLFSLQTLFAHPFTRNIIVQLGQFGTILVSIGILVFVYRLVISLQRFLLHFYNDFSGYITYCRFMIIYEYL